MVYRMLKKKFIPYLKVIEVDKSVPYQHTLSVKRYNF